MKPSYCSNERNLEEDLQSNLSHFQIEENSPVKLVKPAGLNRFGIVGSSAESQTIIQKIHQLKDIDSMILITGESGTGKELVARAIHSASERVEERFEAINCGAIPENLLESELFGHKRGAFTDAKADRKGLFELCDKGTLFLDEIGELTMSLQVKLLRVLQEREIMPLGGDRTVKINTRVIAATNKNLAEEVQRGQFRSDLYYRLNVLQVHLPPLRDRRSDVADLTLYFLNKFNKRFSRQVQPPSRELEARLAAYDWPGNIRELQNAVERAIVLSTDDTLSLENMVLPCEEVHKEGPDGTGDSSIWTTSLSQAKRNFEKAYLERLLEVTSGNISEVARLSGRYRADIYRLMAKYGMDFDEFRKQAG